MCIEKGWNISDWENIHKEQWIQQDSRNQALHYCIRRMRVDSYGSDMTKATSKYDVIQNARFGFVGQNAALQNAAI